MKSKYDYLLTEKENFIKYYIDDRLSSIEIGRIYNINASAVCYLLNKFGVERRDDKHKSKYYLNERYFEYIDSEEKAYWLGFLFADGFVNKDSYVGIALQSSDYHHLEKFRDCIHSNHIIHTYKCSDSCFSNPEKFYSKIIFKSKEMSEDLKKLGCVNHKSLILKFPVLNEKYYSSFIRGYFDGDGSFSFSHKNYDFKIVGTKDFLLKIFEILNNSLDLKLTENNLYKRYKDDKNTYYSSVSNKESLNKFLDYIYLDSQIFLDRKYQKYLDFKDFIK